MRYSNSSNQSASFSEDDELPLASGRSTSQASRHHQSQSHGRPPKSGAADRTMAVVAAPRSNSRKQSNPRMIMHIDTPAMREIRNLQNSAKLLIPRAPFYRLVRDLILKYGSESMRVQLTALEALQEASELYLVQLLEDAYRCTMHRDRVTMMPKDMRLARLLRGVSDPGNVH